MAKPEGKDYVVGKGEVYFDRFIPGTKTSTGERYLGNTPELSTSSDQDTLDHFDADAGLNVKDESITIQDNQTGQLVCDNMNMENVALFFGGERTTAAVTAQTGLTETVKAKLGRYIQLGVSEDDPQGLRDLSTLVVKIGSATVQELGNYEFLPQEGRLYIEEDPADVTLIDDANLILTYNQAVSTSDVVVGKGTEVRGSLRFISRNPVGSQKDYFWPYIKLTANGDFALKSDEWQQVPFSFEVLKKDSVTERVYITSRTPS